MLIVYKGSQMIIEGEILEILLVVLLKREDIKYFLIDTQCLLLQVC